MADIRMLRDRLAALDNLGDDDVIDLASLKQGANAEEARVLDWVANLNGNPKQLTVGELRRFAGDLFVTAGDSDLSGEEFQRSFGVNLQGVGPRTALSAAFSTIRAGEKLEPPASGGVRGVAESDWRSDRTLRCAYLPDTKVLATASGGDEVLSKFLDSLDGSEINALVMDIKEGGGTVVFNAAAGTKNAAGWNDNLAATLKTNMPRHPADLQHLVKMCHDRGLRVIVRQVLFKDKSLVAHAPACAIQDKRTHEPWGTEKMWVNPWSAEARTYNIQIAKRALEAGADEIQWDYVRFPDYGNGDRSNATFPGRDGDDHFCNAITAFLKQAHDELKRDFPNAKIGADVFGYVAAGRNVRDGIGQDVGAMAQYLDVLWPMQYPSHWAWRNGTAFGTQHPETKPEKVYQSTTAGLIRQLGDRGKNIEIRPWVQAFYLARFGGMSMEAPQAGTIGDYVDQQIAGLKGADGNGYALWGFGATQETVIRHRKRTASSPPATSSSPGV